MKKMIASIIFIVIFTIFIFFGWFSLSSGCHRYTKKDLFSYWAYTPDTFKRLQYKLDNVQFDYSYDLDHQKTFFIMTWREVEDMESLEVYLLNFLKKIDGIKKYNCVWIYKDPTDLSNNYQHYCLYKKWNTFELEYFKIEK